MSLSEFFGNNFTPQNIARGQAARNLLPSASPSHDLISLQNIPKNLNEIEMPNIPSLTSLAIQQAIKNWNAKQNNLPSLSSATQPFFPSFAPSTHAADFKNRQLNQPPTKRTRSTALIKRISEITNKMATEIFEKRFEKIDARKIPDTESLPYGNIGKEVETAILYVDMRGSTELQIKENPMMVAKIVKTFLTGMVKVAEIYGDCVRGFAGDRVMVIPNQNSAAATRAVDIAITMQYIISKVLNPMYFLKINLNIEVGIGIDYGVMLATRVGTQRNKEHNDLIWVGPPASIASKITNEASPNEILISSNAFNKLDSGQYPSILWTPKLLDIADKRITVYSLKSKLLSLFNLVPKV